MLDKYINASDTILGMNARNLLYIDRKGPRVTNSKLKSKKILKENMLPTPNTIFVIKNKIEAESFDFTKIPDSFVLKPNKGTGGNGILIIYGKKKKKNLEDEDIWVMPNKEYLTLSRLKTHIIDILDGNFSIENTPDIAIFEERIKIHPVFKVFSKQGMPDIRIIVYKKIPIMAELRLPTIESKGKANLHMGGIGVGIDIASGITTKAIMQNVYIEYHPDSKTLLSGFKIPEWNKILDMAISSETASKINFLGVDIAIDRERGPVVIELNSRPGLAIQSANNSGIKERLEAVSKLHIKNTESAIRVAKEIFGGEVEEEIQEISGKKIIGRTSIVSVDDKEYECKIDTGAYRTSISQDLAVELGYQEVIDHFKNLNIPDNLNITNIHEIHKSIQDKSRIDTVVVSSSNGTSIRPIVNIEFKLEGVDIVSNATISERSNLKYPIIIGRRDLKYFLVDITK